MIDARVKAERNCRRSGSIDGGILEPIGTGVDGCDPTDSNRHNRPTGIRWPRFDGVEPQPFATIAAGIGVARARDGGEKVDQESRPVGAASPGDRVDGRTRLCDFALGSALLWGRPVGAIPLASMAGHRAREARPELSIKSVDQSELSAGHTAGRGGGRPIRRAIDCYPPAVDSGRLSSPITRRPASRFDTTERLSMATAPVAIPKSRSPSAGRRRWPGRLSGRARISPISASRWSPAGRLSTGGVTNCLGGVPKGTSAKHPAPHSGWLAREKLSHRPRARNRRIAIQRYCVLCKGSE